MAGIDTVSTGAKAAAPRTAAADSGIVAASEQQDRFLKLLVAQMRNQDPLNPMDNAQMTSQIAQINTVAGLEKLNAGIESLLSVTTLQMQSQSAAQMPGRTVLVEGDRIEAGAAGGIVGGVQLADAAAAVRVDILDASGARVRTLDLGAGTQGVRSFRWDGLSDTGAETTGPWRMRVQALNAAGQAVEASALRTATVQAATASSTGLMFDLGTAGLRAAGAVKAYL